MRKEPPIANFSGTFDFIGLAPLIRFVAGLSIRGRLSISSGSAAGALFIDGGQVVGAEFGTDYGETALDAVALTLQAGEFSFTDEEIGDHERNMALDPPAVQQHLEKLSEQSKRLAAAIPSPDCVLVPAGESASSEELITLDRGELSLLMRSDGRRTLIELAQTDGLLPTFARVAHLVELGIAECRQPEHAAPTAVGPAYEKTAPEGASKRLQQSPQWRATHNQPERSQGGWARWRRERTPPPEPTS